MPIKPVATHSYTQLIHTCPTKNNAFEQGFYGLSTDIHCGYYYYIYIQETRPKRTPQVLFLKKLRKLN